MRVLKQSFSVNYKYNVYFTKGLFDKNNPVFCDALERQAAGVAKFIVILDERIAKSNPNLSKQIEEYAKANKELIELCEKPIEVPGGEVIKNDPQYIERIYEAINNDGICRHSYVVAIGGGALLDAVGYAAATAHRGIRLIRVPTTVLSQDDSGVGVKNGVNHFGKKNYVGTFAPPYAVLNDFNFLNSLEPRDRVGGLAEATKVALIKDAKLFEKIRDNAHKLKQSKDDTVLQDVICRSAELHMLHIGTQGDPFELGSSRPLDFGHWSAHKLEQTTNHRLRHGEAVAIGVALDSTYSYLKGWLSEKEWKQIIETFENLGFNLYVPELSAHVDDPDHPDSIFKGLIEFREHLGGKLTIMMLEGIGKGKEIHEVDFKLFAKAIQYLKNHSFEVV